MHGELNVFIVHLFTIHFTGTAGIMILITMVTHHGILPDGHSHGDGDGITVGIHLTAAGAGAGVIHLTMHGDILITVPGTEATMEVIIMDTITDITEVITTVSGMPIQTITSMAAEDQQEQV